ncbi:DUF456 domain-containing protein [Janibacter cremeus]|uniref:DUF456 domain-containing protein n=1 Tax=Janibacter cremeus TaxID=1285192 RepID=UPI0023F99AAC|nr:DUF456 domain-containing protein [Janibacter cremeus]WEV78958.1 DUF456 domain-containing protein [Janibacter cremeus]
MTLAAQAAPDPIGFGLLIAVAIYVVGVIGIVLPVLPGLLLCVGAVLLWAIDTGGTLAWLTFGVALVLYLTGVSLQLLIPGRRMKREGVGGLTLLLGVVGAVVGVVVIPLLGLPIGFVAGIFAAEYLRFHQLDRAWSATKSALRGVLHSMGIELTTALAIAISWTIGILLH